MNVLKFGGTSVKDAEAIERLFGIVKSQEVNSVVVVSAMATITNSLVEIVDSIESQQYSKIDSIIKSIKRVSSNIKQPIEPSENSIIDKCVYNSKNRICSRYC